MIIIPPNRKGLPIHQPMNRVSKPSERISKPNKGAFQQRSSPTTKQTTEAAVELFSRSMENLRQLLALGHDDETAAELADRQAVDEVASMLGFTTTEQLPVRNRIVISSNRRPIHQQLNAVIRQEELSETEHGRERLAIENSFIHREPLRPTCIDYPEPINHATCYHGEFEDAHKMADGIEPFADWSDKPLVFDRYNRIIEHPESPPQTHTAVIQKEASPPSIEPPNPYARQRLISFQLALSRGQDIPLESLIPLAEAAHLPTPTTPFGRN